jgi:hypothetical protein
MSNIDDPIEQARSQWLSNADPFANVLTEEVFKHGFPVLGKVFSFWKSAEQKQKLIEFNNWVLDYLKIIDQRTETLGEQLQPEASRVAALAVERILWGASKERAKRFAKVVAHAWATDDSQALQDAASFIHALDELSEDDVKSLHYLYDNQHTLFLPGRDVETGDFFAAYRMTHLIERVGTIGLSREQFYARCARLNGYGLSLPLEKPRGTDSKFMAFRITELGIRLVELLKFNSRV